MLFIHSSLLITFAISVISSLLSCPTLGDIDRLAWDLNP